MLPKYKSLIVRVLIAIGIDIILLSVFIVWMQATPDVSIVEILLLPAIFIINIGLGIASKFIIRRLYPVFLINSVLGALIFHLLFNAWFFYNDHKDFNRMKFELGKKSYELLLDKRDTSYSFSELFNGSSDEFMRGQYKISNDSVYLTDKVNTMVVYKDSLIGFSKDKIAMKKQ
ncbi:MAG: hypothetical protein ACXVB0_21670 [Mucilaginibacter sp.]